MALVVTFIGAPECGDVGTSVWGNKLTGTVEFPLNRGVVIDPAKERNPSRRAFLEKVLQKVQRHPHFTVEALRGRPPKGQDNAENEG